MANHVCVNGTIVNTSNYSSPVPLVGLYIAAASMVCALLIFCDVWAGFRRRKHWFPCRFFSMNSVTLTLISIATKIPVDLTTTMPSAQDQLSKLCGTVFICAAMSFMLPSIGTTSEFESYANVISLTIFVITVVVNICIQLATRVIFSFIVEHSIVLFCMLFLLSRFWFSATRLSVSKVGFVDKRKDYMQNGEGNMVTRLKRCYSHSYRSCPQLRASCSFPLLADVAVVCMTCSMVLVEATLRSYVSKTHLRFCRGISDYGWSMWLVVVSQNLTVAVVTFAIGGRCVFNCAHSGKLFFDDYGVDYDDDYPYLQLQYLFSLIKLPKFAEKSFRYVIYFPVFLANFGLAMLNFFLERGLYGVLDFFGVLDKEDVVTNGEADLERWIEINKMASPKQVTELLVAVPPSRESRRYSIGLNGQGPQISSLHLVVLVELSKLVQTPHSQDKVPLCNVLDEVFEVIHFIDYELNASRSKSRLELMIASVIHQYGLISGTSEFVLKERRDRQKIEFTSEFKSEWWCCCNQEDLVLTTQSDLIRDAISLLNNGIRYLSEEFLSEVVVCGRLEQLFVDMLVTFLAQLPAAIYKHILDSPTEEYGERDRLGLGFICKFESLKSYISFLLPSGANVTSLFDSESFPTNIQGEGTQDQGQGTAGPTHVLESGQIRDDTHAPEQQV